MCPCSDSAVCVLFPFLTRLQPLDKLWPLLGDETAVVYVCNSALVPSPSLFGIKNFVGCILI